MQGIPGIEICQCSHNNVIINPDLFGQDFFIKKLLKKILYKNYKIIYIYKCQGATDKGD